MIPSDDINVAQDVAYCRGCNISYRLSELASGLEDFANLDLQRPPPGAWYSSDGAGTVVGATNRSLAVAFGALFFAVFWNGIVSVFVFFAIAGTLQNLNIPLPAWIPAPKINGGTGTMGAGMTLFLWVFLTPFILIGLTVAAMALTSLFGRTEVTLESRRGRVFTGVGPIGWKRNFEVSEVKDTRIEQKYNREGRDSFTILLETREGKQIKFGSLLTNERRQFMVGALRKTLLR
jgi:hypothetical protein